MKKIFILPITLLALSLAPVFIFAAIRSGITPGTCPTGNCFANPPTAPGPLTTTQSIIDLINKILLWTSTVFWIAAGGFVIYSAYLYLGAAGNEERAKKAKQQLLYAVIAIVIALMAVGLPTLINNFLGSGGGGGGSGSALGSCARDADCGSGSYCKGGTCYPL